MVFTFPSSVGSMWILALSCCAGKMITAVRSEVIFTLTVPGFGMADSRSSFTAVSGSEALCRDEDGDGYGDPANAFCESPELDCEDDPTGDPDVCADCVCGTEACADCARCIHPGAEDFPGDGVDSNCNDNPDCFIVTSACSFG